MATADLGLVRSSSGELPRGLRTENLTEKLLRIEQELLKSPSFRVGQLTAIKESSSYGSLRQNSQESGDDLSLDPDELLYTWPLLKRHRALLAAFLTSVGCFGFAFLVIIFLCCTLGLLGLLLTIAAVEGLFWIFHIWRYQQLNKLPEKQEPSNHDGWGQFHKFIEMCESRLGDGVMAVDIKEYISIWFRGAPFDSIKKDNVMELLSYGFWYKTREEMEAAGNGDIPEKMLIELERVFDIKFPEGYNPHAKFLAHLWEPLRSVYRPFLFYLLTEFSGILSHNILKYMGFLKQRFGFYSFFTFAGDVDVARRMLQSRQLIRQPQLRRFSVMGTPLGEPTPIVFLHGVGLGVLPYLDFICALVCTGHPVIVVEYRHVAMRLCMKIPSCDEVASSVIAILDQIGVGRACFVSHSYGTFVLSRIVKAHGDRVHSACFIDPVCIGMFLPRLLSTFVYRPARTDTLLHYVKDVARLSVSRELGITAAMCRNFLWSDINLWPSELSSACSLVVFSGQDVLVPTYDVKHVLEELAPGTRIMDNPRLAHGEFLAFPSWKLEIIGEIICLAASDRDKSEEEAEAERVVRKTSLMVSHNNMINVENELIHRIGEELEANIARTLSIPWKLFDDS